MLAHSPCPGMVFQRLRSRVGWWIYKYSIPKHRYNNELTHLPKYAHQADSSGADCSKLSADSSSAIQWSWGAWKIWPSTTSSAFSTHCSVDLHQGASKMARITLTLFPQGWKLTDHVTAPSYPADRYSCLAWTSGPHRMRVQTVWTQEHQTGLPMMGTSHKTGRQNKPRPFLPKIYQKWDEYGAAFTTTLLHGLKTVLEALKWVYGIIYASGNTSC